MVYSYNKNHRDALISQIYFGIKLYMCRTGLLSIISSLNTVHTAIGICHTGYADCLLARSGWIPLADSQHNLYDIRVYLLLCIQCWDCWWWTVNLSDTCRVLFRNKFEKLVHLVGFYYKNNPMPPHILVDFVVFPPRHVTDFWGWDAHEARLRCPDDVSGDIGGCSARRALKHKFY